MKRNSFVEPVFLQMQNGQFGNKAIGTFLQKRIVLLLRLYFLNNIVVAPLKPIAATST